MELFYKTAADAIVVFHFAYVGFIVFGQLAILAGILRGWRWIRNAAFRGVHLLAISIVVAESLCGVTCPLTVWEKSLRRLAGDESYRGDFIANWVHDILFFDAETWVFTLVYTLFGLVVLATFALAPPRFRRGEREANSQTD